MVDQSEIPVTVIGGYLGAGKTTLVNHLLRNANGLRLAIMVNEFGELPIDGDLIESQDDNIISLAGGCVCCSYGNDLMVALVDMAKMEPRPDHIILEASGVALPAAIGSSVSLLPDYRLDGIVVLTDAETIRERYNDKFMGDTISRQLDDADIVLLNKTDLVSDEDRIETRAWLETVSNVARIVESENSRVPLNVVLEAVHISVETKDGGHHHHHTSHFETVTLPIENAVDPSVLAQRIVEPDRGIVRAKGFVEGEDGALHTIQIVGKRFEISPAPEGVKSGMVVIGAKPLGLDGLI